MWVYLFGRVVWAFLVCWFFYGFVCSFVCLLLDVVVVVGGFWFGLVIFSPSGFRNNSPSWKGQMTKVTIFDVTSVFCVICRTSSYSLCDI